MISRIPRRIETLKYLKFFWFNNNQIKKIPHFKISLRVFEFELINNQIKKFPRVKNFFNYEKINLSNNKICFI